MEKFNKFCRTCRYANRKPWLMPCSQCNDVGTVVNWKPKRWWQRLLSIFSVILAVMILCGGVALAGEDNDPIPADVMERVTADVNGMRTEVDMLAKLLYRECRGVKCRMEQAAVVWCVLNRVEDKRWPTTISKVVTQRKQFAYRKRTPVTAELKALARDVLVRWKLEQLGYVNVGRVLPKEYVYFSGRNGRNWFRTAYRSKVYWTWDCENPYEEE